MIFNRHSGPLFDFLSVNSFNSIYGHSVSYLHTRDFERSNLIVDKKGDYLATPSRSRKFRKYRGVLVFVDLSDNKGLCGVYDNGYLTYVSSPGLKKYKDLCAIGVLERAQ